MSSKGKERTLTVVVLVAVVAAGGLIFWRDVAHMVEAIGGHVARLFAGG